MAALDPVKIITLPDGSSYDIVDGTLTAGTGIQISNRDSSTGKRTISANVNVGVTDVKVGDQSVVTSGVAKLKGAANKDVASNTGTSADSGKIPALDANGKLNSAVLPAIAITDTFTAASETAMLALSAQTGDVCVRTDISKTYILKATPASTKANWQELLFPADAVSSVNGKTGTVTLSASDVGAAADDHTHTTSLASDSGTSAVSLEANTKYKLTAGGTSVIFTTPADTNTHYTNYFSIKTKVNTTETEVAKFIQSGDKTLKIVQGNNITLTPNATDGTITIAAKDTTYESKEATQSGTDVSLVTTGEKYTWNNKSDLKIGTTATTAAAGNHNHDGTYLKSVTSSDTATGGIEYIEAVSYNAETGTLTLGRKYLHNNK